MARQRTADAFRQPLVWVIGAALYVTIGILIGGVVAVLSRWGRPMPPLVTGFILGVGSASVPWAVWLAITSSDGSASWRIGVLGEEWTAHELAKLGKEWEVVHNVPFTVGQDRTVDVDHVAVGPYGVLIVESKWTGSPTDLSAPALPRAAQDAIKQAKQNAGRVTALLRSKVGPVDDVIPVVVYWGPQVTPPTDSKRTEDGVRIVSGADAASWRPLLSSHRLSQSARDECCAVLRSYAHEQREKIVDKALVRWHYLTRRSSIAAVVSLCVMIGTFLGAHWSPAVDRQLTRLLFGRVGVAIVFFAPPVIGLATLGFAFIAERDRPARRWLRWGWPLVAWVLVLVGIDLVV